MLRRLSLGLLASAISVASLPAIAQEDGSADDLGVMSISLKDVVKPTIGFQGALQGAGTPNQAGIGGFLPLSVGDNSVFFADVLANVNFADYGNDSSIINTTVAGTTISTSSRLGYRWLNGDRSWMYGLNAGYDTRPMATGYADTGVPVTNRSTVFFQQAAVNAEAVSDKWAFNAYALIPTGDTEQQLNTVYQGGALDTFGLDAGYNLTPALRASVGYYYQNGDMNEADGSGVLGRLAYSINNGLTLGTNLSYDSAFKSRFSADIKWRFNTNGGPGKETPKSNAAVEALTSTPSNRDVRVHDEDACNADEWQLWNSTREELRRMGCMDQRVNTQMG
ncbi:carbamoyl-phosphate synthase L chain [Synechococcus sp. ROS8604]|uniref:carbamoyl-phosphate synthase L chain n=1 Tax=Synechococcus sp. ROS8604 TaxID=1442557 RepID=UPI0018619648|nr:carbamoyl-phosphate synthase L chain [Synechococcus sp. ROS8604]QNI87824.1 putative carbamoyl-phosphate synthase L chain [Synechococcus sp. ROS8604]